MIVKEPPLVVARHMEGLRSGGGSTFQAVTSPVANFLPTHGHGFPWISTWISCSNGFPADLRNRGYHIRHYEGLAREPQGKERYEEDTSDPTKSMSEEKRALSHKIAADAALSLANAMSEDEDVSIPEDDIMLTGTTLTTTMLRYYTFIGHTNSVWGCTFSPDGRYIATCSEDNTIKVWDTETGDVHMTLGHRNEPLRVFAESEPQGRKMPDNRNAGGEEGHTDCVWKAVFTLDGKELVSCSRDGTLIMWDVETGKKLRTFTGHEGEICKSVTCCAFNPGATQLNGTIDVARGSMMVSSSWDKTLLLWDVESGAVLGKLKGHSHYVYCCHFSYDGYFVLSCSHDNTAKLWDVLERTCLKTFNGISDDDDDLPGHTKWISWCCWRPNQPKLDQQFLTCSADMTMRLWSVKSAKVLIIFEGHSAPIQACGMSNDGKLAFSVSWDRSIRIWDANTADCVKVVEQAAGVEYGIAVIATKDKTVTRIATTGDHLAKLWQLKAERK